eukprot:CAMPEP_0171452280 /NCGR_PEP_ID=MMETSP0945-20130129/450_1 /TAXON_ID=109269 /ORGANISM="Vaucheria litorea, Strain CCMP2940" /LENGTH=239 /DNA_ID=CAMNT_0011976913 /DNA_START=97 /DNA_END=816 /DNA_ORIENTATION=+
MRADEVERSQNYLFRINVLVACLSESQEDMNETPKDIIVDHHDIIASETLSKLDFQHPSRKELFTKRVKRTPKPTLKAKTSSSPFTTATANKAAAKDTAQRPRRGRKGKSIYRGVSHTREGKFRAVLYVERKQIYLGVFSDEESAARAHDRGVLAHSLGEAYLNFKSVEKEDSAHIPAPVDGNNLDRLILDTGCESKKRQAASSRNYNTADVKGPMILSKKRRTGLLSENLPLGGQQNE